MTRFEQDTSIVRLPVETREEESVDSLFDRWLRRSPASRPRLRSAPAPAPSPTPPPIGDDLADAWFK